MLKGISASRPDVKVVVVDTITAIENDMEMRDMKKSGYDRWRDLAMDVYELYTIASELREDLIVVFGAHQEGYQEDGVTKYRTKHGGQKLTKVNLNSRLSYNLYTDVSTTSDNRREYWFITQTDGATEARSVQGVLPYKMPNDLGEVVGLIRKLDLGIQE